jgi:predicted ester cyclase
MPTAVMQHNKHIVQRWIDEVFNAGNLTSVDELKVSSYLDWTPLPSPYQEVDLPVSGIKDALPEWLSGLPDFEFSADRMTAEDDFVVCLGHWRAHHQGVYKGLAPTDQLIGGTRIDIFRVAGDKMVEHWGCGNELGFLQLIGTLEHEQAEAIGPGDVVRQFVERVLGERDVSAIAQLLDAQAVDHGGSAIGLLGLLHSFPDLEVSVDEVAVTGDVVEVSTTVSGTHGATYMGVAATGRRVRVSRRDRYVVREGRIVECRRLSDDAAIAEQMQA